MLRGIIIAALLLAGCAKHPTAEPSYAVHKEPPSASYTIEQVRYDAARWVGHDASRRSWCHVAYTGSMLPLFSGNSVLLLEKSDGNDLTAGDIAIYATADGRHTISHRVRVVGETAVIFAGDNNGGTGNDGWVPKSRIQWRVAGILYAQR